MTRLAWLCAAILTVSAIELRAAHAESVNIGQIAGWNTQIWYDNDTKRLGHCSGEARYKSGLTLSFLLNTDYVWAIIFRNGHLSTRDNARYDVAFQVDDWPYVTFDGIGVLSSSVIVPIRNRPDLFQQIRRGNILHARIQGVIVHFQLDGTSQLLSGLARCIELAPKIYSPRIAFNPNATTPESNVSTKPGKDSRPKSASTGSGFYVASDGTGITNAHVLDGCSSATISDIGPVRILARDNANDLALVKPNVPSITAFAKLRSSPVQLGESVFALGFPLVGVVDNGLNFTSGSVSSLAGIGADTRLMQFTAPIQPGNSGGPIVDNSGSVVGVTQSKLAEIAALKTSGSLPQNVNFGIKAPVISGFLSANGVKPTHSNEEKPMSPTDVAAIGKGYTFQIKCVSNAD
ncbi:serine protease [Xanthobacter sp. KR7-225]|uniref:S1 family peptidase n=1 Tax=Xanthobacter sp. KR7-225 TaxID=3156613 RepID=UPI0032B46FF8